MHTETNRNTNNYSEAAEDTSPAASVSDSEIMNRETCSDKLWPFIGGVVIGAAGIITVALVADALTYGTGGSSEQPEGEKEMLALPEGTK